MNQIKYHGQPVDVLGSFPAVGEKAKDFELVKSDLGILSNTCLYGKKVLLNIFLSVDSRTCAESVREFNRLANKQVDTEVVCVSLDTPFALARFCEREGLDYIVPASCFRSAKFAFDYGIKLASSVLAGFTARAVICIDEQGTVIYSQLVEEITQQPNYLAATKALS